MSFTTCDLSKANFGVELSTYNTLLEEVTHVVHNAWEVNFNLSLDSFLPHLKGVHQLIKFSSKSVRSAEIFFLSLISTVMNWPTDGGKLPETLNKKWFDSEESRYAESKNVAERLFASTEIQPQ